MVGYSGINSWPHMLPPLQDPHVLAIGIIVYSKLTPTKVSFKQIHTNKDPTTGNAICSTQNHTNKAPTK